MIKKALETVPLTEGENKDKWRIVEGDFSFFVATNLRQLSGI